MSSLDEARKRFQAKLQEGGRVRGAQNGLPSLLNLRYDA